MAAITNAPTITATLVPDTQRPGFLPRHFGPHSYLQAEAVVYKRMRVMSKDYTGGLWRFYELSNGGFFLAPDYEQMSLQVEGNGFSGTLSGDAAGIVATLCTLSDLAFHLFDKGDEAGADRISDAFHALRDYACIHPEAIAILNAID